MSFWKKRHTEEKSVPVEKDTKATTWSADSNKTEVRKTSDPTQARPTNETPSVETASRDRLQERFGNIRSALSKGTNIQGKLSFDVAVRIDGDLGGEIYSSQPVIIGSSGTVKASVEAAALVIQGVVEGDVVVQDRVEILKGGTLTGNIIAPTFVVEEGAKFNGKMAMRERSRAQQKAVSAA